MSGNQTDVDSNRLIQGLWIGGELSAMEQLSIASFIENGHEYHLYTYEPVKNIPRKTIVRDAEEILPRSSAFQYSGIPSWSGFSNFFRYKLLLERGGWWFDTDFVCLRPLTFPEEHVFASELTLGRKMVTSGAIKAPPGSEAMQLAWDTCQSKDPQKIVWGETGPALVAGIVEKFGMQTSVMEPNTFCPIPYREWRQVLNPDFDESECDRSFTLHFWHEMWRSSGQDKNRHYHPASLYERLRRRFLGDQERISTDSLHSIIGTLAGET